MKYKCNTCNEVFEKLEKNDERQEKHSDGGNLTVIEVRDAIGELIEVADGNGAETAFVSSESSLGKEFLMGFGGIGALLRYK